MTDREFQQKSYEIIAGASPNMRPMLEKLHNTFTQTSKNLKQLRDITTEGIASIEYDFTNKVEQLKRLNREDIEKITNSCNELKKEIEQFNLKLFGQTSIATPTSYNWPTPIN